MDTTGRKVKAFLRVSKTEFIEDLLINGKIYMNSNTSMREETDNPEIGDIYEGICSLEQIKVPTVKLGDMEFKIKNENITCIKDDPTKNRGNVFCTYSIYRKDFFMQDNLGIANINEKFYNIGKGDCSILCIFNPKEFIRRIKEACQRLNYPVEHYYVTYVDKDAHHGIMSAFHKINTYSHQQESRFLIPNTVDEPIEFNIGSIEDIAKIINKDDVICIKLLGDGRENIIIENRFKLIEKF